MEGNGDKRDVNSGTTRRDAERSRFATATESRWSILSVAAHSEQARLHSSSLCEIVYESRFTHYCR